MMCPNRVSAGSTQAKSLPCRRTNFALFFHPAKPVVCFTRQCYCGLSFRDAPDNLLAVDGSLYSLSIRQQLKA